MRLAGDIDRLPMDVLAAAQREMDHAGGNRAVAHPVNQDEAPHIGVIGIGIERYSPVQGDDAKANRDQGKRCGGCDFPGVCRVVKRRRFCCGFCWAAWASRGLSTDVAWMFWRRIKAIRIMPAATVRLLIRSIRMKPPRSGLSA